MDVDKCLMFMAHIPVADMSNVVSTLLEYQSVGGYMVSAEETPYQHLHFLVEMSKEDYARYAKRVFIDKYKLRGLAGRKGTKNEGKARQYGKVKEIRDLYKAQAYTAKEGNLCTNLPEDVVAQIIKDSFKKSDKEAKDKEQLFQCMKENMPYIYCSPWEYDKVLENGPQMQDHYAAKNDYWETLQKYILPQGYTLGNFGKINDNLCHYMAQIYDLNGPTKNFRVLFLKNCKDLGYMSTFEYVRKVHRM